MSTTFSILSEFKAMHELTDEIEFDEETGEVIDNTDTIKALLDELNNSKEDKLDNIEYVKREFKMREAALQDEIKRLTARKASMVSKQDQLKGLQEFLMNGEKVKTDKFTFSYGTTKSVEIEDESEIPEAYLKVEFKVNKTEIAKALKAGGAITGAKLIEKTSLRVR